MGSINDIEITLFRHIKKLEESLLFMFLSFYGYLTSDIGLDSLLEGTQCKSVLVKQLRLFELRNNI